MRDLWLECVVCDVKERWRQPGDLARFVEQHSKPECLVELMRRHQ